MGILRGLSACRPRYDVCIVGSGPAGLAAAMECGAAGKAVLVLEAGGRSPAHAPPDIAQAQILRPAYHAPLPVGGRYAFGGSAWAWGGLCVPFDRVDHAPRPHLDLAGWPLTREELDPYLEKAADFLDCGHSADWTGRAPENPSADDLETGEVRLSARSNLARAFASRIAASPLVDLCCGVTVDRVMLDPAGGRAVGLSVRGAGTDARPVPPADVFVLCAGGLQTTRILLETQRDWPRHFGADAVLGRFYMGHLTGEIATVVFDRPESVNGFHFRRDERGRFVQKRLRLGDRTQERHGLMNCNFALRSPPFSDPAHDSGILSLIHLLSRNARFGRVLSTERLAAAAGPALDAAAMRRHLGLILSRPVATGRDAASGLASRFVANLPFVLANRGGRYSLRYHAEQAPRAANRVRLVPSARHPGGSEMEIDFDYGAVDVASVVRSHEVLDALLRNAGQGHVEFWSPEHRGGDVLALARDGYHQIGTTRMGHEPATSVTGPDGRVHGLANLFIASSSLFPTSGAANPTLTIVALALRLAATLGAAGAYWKKVSRT